MNPTTFADQYQAATRDAITTLLHWAVVGTGSPTTIATPPGSWITAQAHAVLRTMRDGTARCCPHLGPSPRRVHAALWAPGRVVCPLCLPTLRPRTALEDNTCDQCRRLVRAISSCAAAIGPIVLAFGLCQRCLPANTTHPTEETAR